MPVSLRALKIQFILNIAQCDKGILQRLAFLPQLDSFVIFPSGLLYIAAVLELLELPSLGESYT